MQATVPIRPRGRCHRLWRVATRRLHGRPPPWERRVALGIFCHAWHAGWHGWRTRRTVSVLPGVPGQAGAWRSQRRGQRIGRHVPTRQGRRRLALWATACHPRSSVLEAGRPANPSAGVLPCSPAELCWTGPGNNLRLSRKGKPLSNCQETGARHQVGESSNDDKVCCAVPQSDHRERRSAASASTYCLGFPGSRQLMASTESTNVLSLPSVLQFMMRPITSSIEAIKRHNRHWHKTYYLRPKSPQYLAILREDANDI